MRSATQAGEAWCGAVDEETGEIVVPIEIEMADEADEPPPPPSISILILPPFENSLCKLLDI